MLIVDLLNHFAVDGHGGPFEDGESAITDRARAFLVEQENGERAVVSAPDDLLKLQRFAAAVTGDFPDHSGLDGFEVQEIAEQCGLLKVETRTVPCGDWCQCADDNYPGEVVECLRTQPVLHRAVCAAGKAARGIEPEGRGSEGPRAKPEEPGAAGTRPDQSGLSAAAPAVELKRPDCFEFAMDFLGCPQDDEVRAYVEALESALTTHREHPAAQQERQDSARIDFLERHRFTICTHWTSTAIGPGFTTFDGFSVQEMTPPTATIREAIDAALAAQAPKEKL
jgi:hypothetical protein